MCSASGVQGVRPLTTVTYLMNKAPLLLLLMLAILTRHSFRMPEPTDGRQGLGLQAGASFTVGIPKWARG